MAIDNRQLARRLLDEVWGKGKVELIDELIDPAYEGHDPMVGTLNRDGLRESVKAYRTAFPDLKFAVNSLLVDGNFVVTRWTANGTHRGPLLSLAATGKTAVVTGINVAEVHNGRVISDYAEFDALGMMRQLGTETLGAPVVEGPKASVRTAKRT